MLSRKHLWNASRNDMEIKQQILAGERPEIPTQCPELYKQLIQRCWAQDFSHRPSSFEEIREVIETIEQGIANVDINQPVQMQILEVFKKGFRTIEDDSSDSSESESDLYNDDEELLQ